MSFIYKKNIYNDLLYKLKIHICKKLNAFCKKIRITSIKCVFSRCNSYFCIKILDADFGSFI